MYVSMVFQDSFIGYAAGTAPVISYHHGAQSHKELRNLLRRSFVLIGVFALAMFAAAEPLARPLAMVYVSHD